MPYNTQLKLHDNAVVSMDLLLNATSKQNNSTLSGNLGSLLFGHARHAQSHPKNIT